MASKKPKKENDRIEVFINNEIKSRSKIKTTSDGETNRYNWHRVKGHKNPNVRYASHGYETLQGAKKQAIKHAEKELWKSIPVYVIYPDGTFKQV